MSALFRRLFSWLLKPRAAAGSKHQAQKRHAIPQAPPIQPIVPNAPAPTPLAPSPQATIQHSGPKLAPIPPAAPVEPIIEAPPSEAIVDLHIGLDLGTSCSKIVIGDAFLDHCHGVQFDPAAQNVTKYLFPTRFFETPSQASLTGLPGATTRADLKLRLIDAVEQAADATEQETDLAIYLALVLHHTFGWFSQHAAANHRNRRLCWWLNVGFPAKHIEGNPRLAESYNRACVAAIRAVDSGGSISRTLLQRCMSSTRPADGRLRLDPDRVHLYPEIAAQLAGYAYSPYRKDGPLLLLDIGAGTLDVSTLILHRRNGEEVCSFHFCEVAPLGVFRLYQETHQAMSRVAPATLRPLVSASANPAWLAPTSASELLIPGAPLTASLESAFHSAREFFSRRCLDSCHANFARFKAFLDEPFLRERRRPPAFRRRVNFILSGGGSRAQFYRDLYPDPLEERILNLTSWHLDRGTRRSHQQGLQRIYFTQPEKFRAESIGATDFDRLSVAHGLSMGVETLMRITAKEASDRQWHTTNAVG